jgi:hypothetical protein
MFNDTEYYMVKELEKDPYNIPCIPPNKFIKMHPFHPDAYVRARYSSETDEWVVVNTKTPRDYLFLLKSHCKCLLARPESVENIPPLPSVIRIRKTQKFTIRGSPITIKTVGERKYNKCFFSVEDFGTKFGYHDLVKDIQKSTGTHEEGFDYVYFMDGKRKVTYFTYYGILRQFFIARKKRLEHFLDWICTTLFAAQMGDKQDRTNLAAKLVGVDPETVRDVFSKSCYDLPYIYLFRLGTAKDLRKSMKIPKSVPDHFVIYKWGRCKSLRTRTKDHDDDYGKIEGVQLQLVTYGFVDIKNHSTAESDIADYFRSNDHTIELEKKDGSSYNELAAFDPKIEKHVKAQYERVVIKHRGALTGLALEIEHYKAQIEIKNEQLLRSNEEITRLQMEINELKKRLEKTEIRADKAESRADKAESRAVVATTELVTLLKKR